MKPSAGRQIGFIRGQFALEDGRRLPTLIGDGQMLTLL